MISSMPVAKTRSTRTLSSALPGTIAPYSTASSRLSRRSSAFRAALSGPWQAKQFSARIGRMSRLYSSLSAAAARAAAQCRAKSATDKQSKKWELRTIGILTETGINGLRRGASRRE